MAVQNLISAELDPKVKEDVQQKLSDVKNSLGFLLSLQGSDIQGLFKAGNGYAPFLDKAFNAASNHPEILPGVFDAAEFKKDYQLSKDLSSIVSQVNELADSLQNTLIAVNSDAITAAMEVYAAVKQNRDKVPGLNVAADEMAEFFKRSRKKTETGKA